MPLHLACPWCNYTLDSPLDGRPVRCPECGRSHSPSEIDAIRHRRKRGIDVAACCLLLLTPLLVLLIGFGASALHNWNGAALLLPCWLYTTVIFAWYFHAEARTSGDNPSVVMVFIAAPIFGFFALIAALLILAVPLIALMA